MKVPKAINDLDPKTKRNFLALFLTALFFWIGLTTLLPTLPTYAEDLGGTRQQVGFVMGAFAVGLLGSRVWLGQVADQKGRKIVILIGTFVGAIAPLGYLAVHNIPALMAIRAFHGISVAAFTTGYSALVVDLAPMKQRGELIGYMSLAVPVGMALGPALGGYLAESAGYTPLFLTAGGLGLTAYLMANQVNETVPVGGFSQKTKVRTEENRSSWELLSTPSLLIPSLVLLLIGLVFGNLATFLPLFIREIHLNLNAGLFYSFAAIASFISRVWTGRASDLYGRGVFISGSIICYILAMMILAWANSPQMFLLAATLEGIGGGVLIPMIIALISDRSSSHERGRVFALCVSGFDVGIAIAGPIFGLLGESLGYRGLFVLASGLALLAFLLFGSQSNPSLTSSLRFATGRGKDRYAKEQTSPF